MENQDIELPKLQLKVRDKAAMYPAYMAFLDQGGVFIPTAQNYDITSMVQVDLQLLELNTAIEFTGKVVWVTPSGAQHNRRQGVGVEFIGEAGMIARQKIETYLGEMLAAAQVTYTL